MAGSVANVVEGRGGIGGRGEMANGTWLTFDALHVSLVTVSCNEIAIISPDYCSTNEIVRGVLEPSSFGLEDFFRTCSRLLLLSLPDPIPSSFPRGS